MSGVDAAGGFAYQHAQAIQLALLLAQDDDLDRIRVEAENDVVDAEIWSRVQTNSSVHFSTNDATRGTPGGSKN